MLKVDPDIFPMRVEKESIIRETMFMFFLFLIRTTLVGNGVIRSRAQIVNEGNED